MNRKVKRTIGELYKDSCWICEGWSLVDLSWTHGVSGNGYLRPGFLVLDHRGWKGIYLGNIDKSTKTYSIHRMLPPGPVYFLYAFKFREYANRKHKVTSS